MPAKRLADGGGLNVRHEAAALSPLAVALGPESVIT